eukprot:Plantae.Rhodophyta-Purpureofilum_apyrenoidigerum.ctg9804.p1 GENE.Plantae.Rhodophyta-Purpureofilum_apyrenoidigerum.ctg9804~~Plantae.Rhodophyta-Purpureofilum_apyrenoidigerum.ctg9804.p1  ORF type:complete len:440 (+),score=50.66 Plantae.Rhodophyta-Purpureofilum_apyrenoidigerum.ctg9804:800-2119(+)
MNKPPNVSEHAYNWLYFMDSTVSHSVSMLNTAVALRVRRKSLLPDWMQSENEEVDATPMLFYPTYIEAGCLLGRMNTCFTNVISENNALGNAIEQRFAITWHGRPDPALFCSVLLEDDSVYTIQVDIARMLSGQPCSIQRSPRHRPEEERAVFGYTETEVCNFCVARGTECECARGIGSRGFRSRFAEKMDKLFAQGANTHPMSVWAACRSLAFSMQPKTTTMRMWTLSNVSNVMGGENTELRIDTQLNFKVILNLSEIGNITQQHLCNLSFFPKCPSLLLKLNSSSEQILLPPPNSEAKKVISLNAKNIDGKPQCEFCFSTFSRKYELKRHVYAVHFDVKEHACDICGKLFALRQNLISHVAEVHEKKRDEHCPVCDMTFSTKHKVRRHIQSVHMKLRPFVCKTCNSSYFQQSDLRRHIRAKHGSTQVIGLKDSLSDL